MSSKILQTAKRGLTAIGHAINALEVVIIIGSISAMALLLLANVIARTFFSSLYFAEELSELLVILTTFAGLSYSVRKAMHIRMGAFLDAMPPQVERIFLMVIALVSAVIMGIMTWFAWEYLANAFTRGHTSPALRIPKWTFYIILPVGFFLATIQFLRTFAKNLREKDPWQSAEQQSEYEEEHPGAPVV